MLNHLGIEIRRSRKKDDKLCYYNSNFICIIGAVIKHENGINEITKQANTKNDQIHIYIYTYTSGIYIQIEAEKIQFYSIELI